jgi:quinolinate synthase
VILPDINAGCPMADMIDSQRLLKAKKENPSAIVVTYVNSSADVKAYSDICCTSSNAIEVVRSIKGNKILFTPDENLGRYVARHCPDKEFIFWKGFCPTHHFIKAEQINALKERYNDAVAMVHPECREEVIDCADYVGSTSQMFDWARQSQAKTIIVGTELGMVYRLKKENPDKIFLPPTADTLCPNMKLTTLEKVYHSLKKLAPKITVDENIRTKALNAVTKMLQIG